MKQQKILNSIFKTYYGITLNRFYTWEQQSKIMSLIAWASDKRQNVSQLIQIVDKINESNFPTPAICKNSLILSVLTKELSDIEVCALRALCTALEDTKEEQPLTMCAWLRELAKPNMEIERAIFAYAQGQNDVAIEILRHARAEGAIIPIDESIAIISLEAEKYELALEYATRALHFDMDIVIDHSCLKEIVKIATSKLDKQVANKIVEGAKGSKKGRIGF